MKSKKYECRVNHTTVEVEAATAQEAAKAAFYEERKSRMSTPPVPVYDSNVFFISSLPGFDKPIWGHFVVVTVHVYVREKVDS